MLTERIRNTLTKIGLAYPRHDTSASLEQGGLDSLMLALLIIELEREFKIKIPVMPLVKEHYESINSIEKHLIELGAQ
ncbi:acyl carrier protein [Legionella parisiensis]|uniref:D-alanine--poly(Phosphoribitol) ligase subunit 2 n=1 Tax=Legionella parisiensis TaxID=45071 RepID=A0A1E5JU93_9GAMM|nr:acyl carrier protein [Legionella parisiensis]KTD40304.1 acyl carrier protein [Legionella parisiensis]OEH47638.1 D-alanine--poly(phosphoribitol) ligase subunit 2 [Legionella parisiensis]STX77264.1 acyl carrier protein [Legionella parisiensis]